MIIGIIGPAQSGKTTVFDLLTGFVPDQAHAHRHEVRLGMTHVPDPRVEKLAAISGSKKATHIPLEYVDTPALEAGASKSEWFETAMESGIRNTDALLLVARAFGAEEMPMSPDPLRDVRMVQEELILADLIILEKRLDRLERQRKVKALTAEEKTESDILARGHEHLLAGQPLRTLDLEKTEKKALRGFQFLSEKPVLVIVNAAEDRLAEEAATAAGLEEKLKSSRVRAVALSALLEGEIARLSPDERAAFMSDIGVKELARDRVLTASLDMLGLITFLTTNEKETRAWPAHRGDTALDAAGTIHTDMAHGFIRAEVVHWDDLEREGGFAPCKTKGLMRLEGKDYLIRDGDVLLIRHHG